MVLGQQGKHNVDPSKVEVGEIDTSSPFESVKHAVSLFGAVAFTRKRTQPSAKKSEPHSSEKVSVKESRLHLAEKELNQLKHNLHNAEMTRARALAELYKTRETIKELNKELSVVSKSKDVVLEETDKLNDHMTNVQGKSVDHNSSDGTHSSWKKDVDTFRVQYLAAALELNAAKQELGKFRLDYDSALRSYKSVLRQSSEAEAATKANNEAATELSGKIAGMKELIEQAKVESEKAEVEASREILSQEYKIKLNESSKAIEDLKNELNPEAAKDSQKQLECIADQSEALKQDINKAKASYSELATMLTLELDNAKATLEKVIDEGNSLRRLIESLKLELENVKMELLELKEEEAEAKQLGEDLEAKLRKCKTELEGCMTVESEVRSTCDQMTSTLEDLVEETQKAKQEAKNFTVETEAVMKEADAHKHSIKDYEAKLQLLLQEAEAARSAEGKALEEIKLLSESKDSAAKIILSKEEFNSLCVKIKDSATIADMKVSVAMVQVEAVKTRHNNSQKILEESQEELQKIKLVTSEALKMAGEAEAGRNELEGELIKLGYRRKSAKTDWEIEIETEASPEGISLSRSYSTMSASRRRVTLGDILKMDREGREKSKRSPLRSLSGIFHRRRN
ncbi:hypothetical protein QQ045_016942 [Rhodiola kirilowii]